MLEIRHLEFETRAGLRAWLEANHGSSEGVWIRFIKGNSSFTAGDALEEALCFGWIDGRLKRLDDASYIKYFARRGKNSRWSSRNRKLVESLLERGLVEPAGIEVVERAMSSGQWRIEAEPVYSESGEDALRHALAAWPDAIRLFDGLSPSRRRQYAGFFCEARAEETRRRRLAKILEALETGCRGILF